MIGYDEGAPIDRDDGPSGLFAGFDLSMGVTPEMDASIEGNVNDLTSVLFAVVEAADKIYGERGGKQVFGTDEIAPGGHFSVDPANVDQDGFNALFGDANTSPQYTNHGGVLDATSAIFSSPITGSMVVQAGGDVGSQPWGPQDQKSGFSGNDVLASNIATAEEAENITYESPNRNLDMALPMEDIYDLERNIEAVSRPNWNGADDAYDHPQAQNDGVSGDKLDPSLGVFESSDALGDQSSGDRVGAGHFDMVNNLSLKSLAEADTAEEAEHLSLPWTNHDLFDPYDGRFGQASSADENASLYDRIDDFPGYYLNRNIYGNGDDEGKSRANIGGLGDAYGEFVDRDPVGGGVWNSMGQGTETERFSRRQLLDDIGPDEAVAANSQPDGMDGLFGMTLENAERILPEPASSHEEDRGEIVADVGRDRRQEAPIAAGGRSGPSGYRNDPIYTIAIGAAAGTMMPMVPTPGTSTRTPPLPGQRNLP